MQRAIVCTKQADVSIPFHPFEIHQVVVDVQLHHVVLDHEAEGGGGTEVDFTADGLLNLYVAPVGLHLPKRSAVAAHGEEIAAAVAMIEEDAALDGASRCRFTPVGSGPNTPSITCTLFCGKRLSNIRMDVA